MNSSSFQMEGELFKVNEAQQITERFRKREFVLRYEDNPKYPQTIQFQVTGDRCELLDGYKVGDRVKLEFNIRGREWTSPKGDIKYFNSLEVWRLENVSQHAGEGAIPPAAMGDEPPPHTDEDLPF